MVMNQNRVCGSRHRLNLERDEIGRNVWGFAQSGDGLEADVHRSRWVYFRAQSGPNNDGGFNIRMSLLL